MAISLGVDGLQDVGMLVSSTSLTACCPPTICSIDKCALACNFINLLPRGPMWDEAKATALTSYAVCDAATGAVTVCKPDSSCTSLVAHSVYTAYRLADVLTNGVAVAVREASPHTAYDTMDDWLDRLGWVDCMKCKPCDLFEATPYDNPSACGPVYCSPTTPTALSDAVKHGIILALSRVQMGIVRNLAGINFVIEPLGAKLSVDTVCTPGVVYDGGCRYRFNLQPISQTMKVWRRDPCPNNDDEAAASAVMIDAFFYDDNCATDGVPRKLYPAVLAAECIIRSLLPDTGVIKITRLHT
jgi:hypothetical protein